MADVAAQAGCDSFFANELPVRRPPGCAIRLPTKKTSRSDCKRKRQPTQPSSRLGVADAALLEPTTRSLRAVAALAKAGLGSREPFTFEIDSSLEWTTALFATWCRERGVSLQHTAPASPNGSIYFANIIRRFNAECLHKNEFSSLEEARRVLGAWQSDYNGNLSNAG